MKIEYLPGTTEGSILLCVAQIGAIQRMIKNETGIFSLKDIQVLLSAYQKHIANYFEICTALNEGVEVDLIPAK